MDIILWRHAEAEVSSNDLERSLTRAGQKQAAIMARWLRERLPKNYQVISSEAQRSIQTACTLSKNLTVSPVFNPEGHLLEMLNAIEVLDESGTFVLVGHQPWIGGIASTLMTGQTYWWPTKKAGIWWLQRREKEEQSEMRLKAMLTPSVL